ncbi:MAG: hypothetical protein QG594_416 [Bacteroidota bacterium]|jgi:8-oxo-dGTP diphosphatase|nr:hypothetical protein [Bacteroidota bacterium]
MRQTVTAILISTENEFILQLRDDKPGIASPGKVANFGGNIEPGETPVDTMVREVYEELNIKLNKEDFQSLGYIIKKDESTGGENMAHLFLAKNINKSDLVLNEGQAIVYINIDEPLNETMNLSVGTKLVLDDFKNKKLEPLDFNV